MTERLYETDSYAVSFDAKVTAAETAEGRSFVTLDRTLFFPEEGGQSCDRGTICGLTVTDVQIRNGEIVHTVEGLITAGTEVHGEIDWEYRFRNMQMHSGEHVFSGLVFRLFGFSNVGFHLSENSATMDYNGKLSKEDVQMLEERANRVITEGHRIRAWIPSETELASLSYRSKKEIDGAVRLVEIEGVDLCACCVPHVRNTSEIGFLKIISLENYKGGVRLQYRCGLRALEHYRECLSLLSEAGQLLSAKQEDVPAALKRLQEESKQLSFRLTEAERKLVSEEIRRRYEKDAAEYGAKGAASHGSSDAAACGGTETLTGTLPLSPLFMLDADPGLLRFAMDEAKKYFGGPCVVTAAQDSERFRYLMEGNESVSELQKELKERFGAKGGGAPGSVSGSVCASGEALKEFFKEHGIA